MTDRIPFLQYKGSNVGAKGGASRTGFRGAASRMRGIASSSPASGSGGSTTASRTHANLRSAAAMSSGSPSQVVLKTTGLDEAKRTTTNASSANSTKAPRGRIVYGGVESMLLSTNSSSPKLQDKYAKTASSQSQSRVQPFDSSSKTRTYVNNPSGVSISSHRSQQQSPPPGLRFKPGYGPVHNPHVPVYEQYEMPSGIF
ncbi:unnamed protein product [Amoebophrya sp. A120]|nr:unnamed protein product [Amoebophrya sp. A120]|eukprot:GSA120T00001709001.1